MSPREKQTYSVISPKEGILFPDVEAGDHFKRGRYSIRSIVFLQAFSRFPRISMDVLVGDAASARLEKMITFSQFQNKKGKLLE